MPRRCCRRVRKSPSRLFPGVSEKECAFIDDDEFEEEYYSTTATKRTKLSYDTPTKHGQNDRVVAMAAKTKHHCLVLDTAELNTTRKLVSDLGIPPARIHIPNNDTAELTAMRDALASSSLKRVKTFGGTWGEYLDQKKERFGVVYYDACCTASDAALEDLARLFRDDRLADRCVVAFTVSARCRRWRTTTTDADDDNKHIGFRLMVQRLRGVAAERGYLEGSEPYTDYYRDTSVMAHYCAVFQRCVE